MEHRKNWSMTLEAVKRSCAAELDGIKHEMASKNPDYSYL